MIIMLCLFICLDFRFFLFPEKFTTEALAAFFWSFPHTQIHSFGNHLIENGMEMEEGPSLQYDWIFIASWENCCDPFAFGAAGNQAQSAGWHWFLPAMFGSGTLNVEKHLEINLTSLFNVVHIRIY